MDNLKILSKIISLNSISILLVANTDILAISSLIAAQIYLANNGAAANSF
jgi:hypothetical protein